jgi:hypothetical protein
MKSNVRERDEKWKMRVREILYHGEQRGRKKEESRRE